MEDILGGVGFSEDLAHSQTDLPSVFREIPNAAFPTRTCAIGCKTHALMTAVYLLLIPSARIHLFEIIGSFRVNATSKMYCNLLSKDSDCGEESSFPSLI